jgi:hypothetical protein
MSSILAADYEIIRRTAKIISNVSTAYAQTSGCYGNPDKKNTNIQASYLPPLFSHDILEPAEEPIEISTIIPGR